MGPGSVLSFGERLGHRGDTLLLALETPGFPLLSVLSFQGQCAVGGELPVRCSWGLSPRVHLGMTALP